MRVGWYVHHHGAGHRTRAGVVGEELARRGHEVTLIGSSLGDPALLPGVALTLPMDFPLDDAGPVGRAGVDLGGLAHWAPLRHSGFRQRMADVAAWVESHHPEVVVVDVSTEVALLVRLLGVPVVVVAQPGDRRDPGHGSALAAASAVLAPWPTWATPDLWRAAIAGGDGTGGGWDHRLVAVGGIARPPMTREPSTGDSPEPVSRRLRGVVFAGSEGFEHPGLVEHVTASVDTVEWTVAGGRTWLPDVAALLAASDVVVTHAGQNSVAEVAAARVPAVVVPQSRPFDEQDHMGAALSASGLARVVARDDVARTDWSEAVADALARGGAGWARWNCAGAVGRAADLVVETGRG